MKLDLPLTEELDFHYLLGLMPSLSNISEFQWLPELFSIVGYESLITLCKYAGGETIKIPTLENLANSIESLQYFYDVYIKHRMKPLEIPDNFKKSVFRIREIYDADNDSKTNQIRI